MNNTLPEIIREQIETDGAISVARYMQLALQHPEHGYYVKGDPLGHDGDFITAPEISQMFGEMVGLWCAEVWRMIGKPSPFAWLEMGPGRGTLMHDALRATEKVEGFHQAAHIYLMESNETLRHFQYEKLASYDPRFIDDPCALPPLPLIAVANEFFDAQPVHQYVKTERGWRERLVSFAENRFVFVNGEAEAPLPFPETLSFYEVAPQSVALVREIALAIASYGGGALIIDYGYTQPSGQDTLQAVSGHASANPLDRPGEVDITTHVDFAALRMAAEKAGAKASAVIGQGDFLEGMGIELRATQLKKKADEAQIAEIDAALKRLVDADQMGQLFKAMAITRPNLNDLPGFP